MQSYNIFCYTNNNPVAFYDPDGRDVADAVNAVVGLIVFYELYERLGKSNYVPFPPKNANIVDFDWFCYEFNLTPKKSATVSFLGERGQSFAVASIIYLFGVVSGPAGAASSTFICEWVLGEILSSVMFPKNLFSTVSPGDYAIFEFRFIEEDKRHAYLNHDYHVLVYLGTHNKGYSSFEGMWYERN